MSVLVDTTRLPVRDEKGNIVLVRPRMSFGIKAQLQRTQPDLRLLRYYQLNIVGWSGPLFKGIECTPENIENLDTDNPDVARMMELVGTKLDELNTPPELPKESTPTTSTDSTAGVANTGTDESGASESAGATEGEQYPQ